MAPRKKAKTGGKARFNPRLRRLTRTVDWAGHSEASDMADDYEDTTFTMRDAARNSEHPRSFWSTSALSLRHRAMTFVPSEEISPHAQQSQTAPKEQQERSSLPGYPQKYFEDHVPTSLEINSLSHADLVSDEDGPEGALESSIIDHTTPVSVRQPSSPSESGDEVVFAGRNNLGPVPSDQQPWQPVDQTLPSSSIGSDKASSPDPFKQRWIETQALNGHSDIPNGMDCSDVEQRRGSHLSGKLTPSRCRKQPITARTYNGEALEAALDDYVANIRVNGQLQHNSESKNGGETTVEKNGWTHSDIEDFEDLSTSDEIFDTVKHILSKRHRSGNLQYLVVWQDQTTDDARWIPSSSLNMPGAADLIEAFEEEERQFIKHQVQETDTDESDSEINWSSGNDFDPDSDGSDEEDFHDEEDLIERRIARMTDEHIARLLQKQESLGLSSEELQIFDGVEDVELSDNALPDRSRTLSRKKRDQKYRKQNYSTAILDAEMALGGVDYGDFDVMDRERQSLQPRKNQSNPFLFDLSDPDLARDLQNTWASDRKKKRLRKQEREELRAQGLLGAKNKFKPDLKAKYNDGMSLAQIEKELDDFLINGQQDSLSLPPMAKHERKIMHDIANAFGLKSKSQGSNKKRFTILYKTSRTADFDRESSQKLRAQIHRRFFPRLDQKGRGAVPRSRANQNQGQSIAYAGYRDGEVVGAAAPELGTDNRGRAMLEKMGWSMGTALGALNNQGILTPIEHVVKNSRAGLG